jgi:hypothetical protein
MVWCSFAFEDFLAVREAAGCKVNDVALAIITDALRRHLEARDVPTSNLSVRAFVPVSVRRDVDRLALGNLITAMVPALPISSRDPVERLRRVSSEMRDLKECGQARAVGLLLAVAGAVPHAIEALVARLAPDWPLVSTVCTNVPGPREARWLLGRRITDVHPIVPLFQSMGLEFAVMSYDGRISICATLDPALVPDADQIGAAIRESGEELLAAMGVAKRSPRPAGDQAERLRESLDVLREVVAVRERDSLLHAYRMMRQWDVHRLPVLDERQRLLGFVTDADVARDVSSGERRIMPNMGVHWAPRGAPPSPRS